MTTLTESRGPRSRLLNWLAIELAPHEGRWAAVTRIAASCTIAVAIGMVFEIPQPTYVAYIVFAISKDERAATVTSALGGLAAVTLAIVLTLGLSLIDTAEPALRLPLMALATFAAMFTSRTFALGPIAYLAGFVIVLLQSTIDDVPTPEALTRAILWLWVVILVPVSVTVVVSLVFAQGAVLAMQRTLLRVLEQLAATLTTDEFRPLLPQWRAQLVPLLETARHHHDKTLRFARLTPPLITALLDALVILDALPLDVPTGERLALANKVSLCRAAVESGAISAIDTAARDVGALGPGAPAVHAFASALSRFVDALEHDDAPPATPAAPTPKQLFVPDAFSNPAHWQFALKTTIALMISYAIYTLLNWPGLRTAIVTCFFVALGSLGETIHKLVLRISGALIGGLIAGLCIVFVLPHLTDIGQLCLLIGSVSLAAAWVATSSELLSYAGMQIAFAFFLGVLQGYAPATDLTVLRDRIVGILLGNVMITIVFSSLWPQSARSGIRAAIADALRAIAAVIRRTSPTEAARVRAVQALVRADHFRALSRFELQMLSNHSVSVTNLPTVAAIEHLAGAAFVWATEAHSADLESTFPLAQWAELAADGVAQNLPLPPSPAPRQATLGPVTNSAGSLTRRALEQLEAEVQHVASAMR